jgi:hypothetical protein
MSLIAVSLLTAAYQHIVRVILKRELPPPSTPSLGAVPKSNDDKKGPFARRLEQFVRRDRNNMQCRFIGQGVPGLPLILFRRVRQVRVAVFRLIRPCYLPIAFGYRLVKIGDLFVAFGHHLIEVGDVLVALPN